MLPSVSAPKFTVEIPSSGKTIKMRPYCVAEEKILKIARQSIDDGDIASATTKKLDVVKDIISRCILSPEGVDVDKMAVFDIEYILIRLCQESGGSTVRMMFAGDPESSCEVCKNDKRVLADLSKVSISRHPDHTNKLDIVNNIGVIMKYPTYQTLSDIVNAKANNDIDMVLTLLAKCIDSFYDDKTVYDDFTEKEVIEFLTGLTLVQLQQFDKFFDTMPTVQLVLDLSCKACGKKDAYTLRGIHDFF